ncbi:MAG: nucleotidyl transferase AbiEii/AbiGii toxin family protein [Rhizobium sp.]|nr:nucleotidyl transferase AbiEii/AbiGii toxin family protein [Rhizobium sp.]
MIDHWSLGGGTALMLQIQHRESDDIDIFLDDPQLLPYLDPARQNFQFEITPSTYSTDGAGFLKLAFGAIGEIDFIIAGPLTDRPLAIAAVIGREVRLETVEEIIAKKIFYRGSRLAPRDVFDIAAASRNTSSLARLRLGRLFRPGGESTLADRCKRFPVLADMIAQLQIRPAFKEVASGAPEIAAALLREALSAATPAS